MAGGSEHVAEKILAHSKALGDIDKFAFQKDNAGLTHKQPKNLKKIIGKKVTQ